MKLTTPLYILTTITGLLINQTALADDSSKTARFYEKKDLPEFSRKIIAPDINSNKDSHESFSINRDALFYDDSNEFSDFETNAINTSNDKQFLSGDTTNPDISSNR